MDPRKLRAAAPGGPAPCSAKVPVVPVMKGGGRPENAEEWRLKAEVAAPATRGVMLASRKWPQGRASPEGPELPCVAKGRAGWRALASSDKAQPLQQEMILLARRGSSSLVSVA